MRFIIVFLMLFHANSYAEQREIRVYEGQKLIAADKGRVTFALLRQKMLRKGIDISDPKYRVEDKDISQELAQEELDKANAKRERKEIKSDVESISDPVIKKILKRLIRDSYGK